jgi:hypothetical protein
MENIKQEILENYLKLFKYRIELTFEQDDLIGQYAKNLLDIFTTICNAKINIETEKEFDHSTFSLFKLNCEFLDELLWKKQH